MTHNIRTLHKEVRNKCKQKKEKVKTAKMERKCIIDKEDIHEVIYKMTGRKTCSSTWWIKSNDRHWQKRKKIYFWNGINTSGHPLTPKEENPQYKELWKTRNIRIEIEISIGRIEQEQSISIRWHCNRTSVSFSSSTKLNGICGVKCS